MDEIEEKILNDIIPPFASKYEGEGWSPDPDSRFSSLAEAMQENEDSEEAEEDSEDNLEVDVKAESGWTDALDLENFIEEYKQEHDLNTLDEKTRLKLEEQYHKVVDKNTYPDFSSSSLSQHLNTGLPGSTAPGSLRNLLDPDPYSSAFNTGFNEPPLPEEDIDPFKHTIPSIGFE